MGRSRQTTKEYQNIHVSWGPPASTLAATIGRWKLEEHWNCCVYLQESAYHERPFLLSSDLVFGVVSLKGRLDVTIGTETGAVIHMKPKLAEMGTFLDDDMKAISLFNGTDGFIYTHTCIYPQSLCPEIPREGETGQPMKICAKEATDVAVWP